MKRVVSVSLGSSKGDKSEEVELLGERYQIRRIGTDGDLVRFAALFREFDGEVDALGIGGCDLYLSTGDRRYIFRQIARLVSGAKTTPVVDGSGLKHTLERTAIRLLQDSGVVDFARERVLLVSAVDRYGMAQALDEVCPQVLYGDLMFGVGLPIPLRSYRAVQAFGRTVLPIVTRLPFQWFYPTGGKQESRTPRFRKAFEWATIVCGDTHFIRRYMPDRMDGKTVITQTLRKHTIEEFRAAGVARLITTTPVIGGETFATNVMEAVIVAHLGRPPAELSDQDYRQVLDELGWQPTVLPLAEVRAGTSSPASAS